MELDKAIDERVSVRSFKDEDVSEEEIKRLLEAGIKAPNASGLENWKFVVHMDETRDEVRKLVTEGQSKYYRLLGTSEEKINKLEKKYEKGMYDAPAYIGVYVDKEETIFKDYDELEFYWSIESASLAIENMMLKAVDLDLGTCYVGVTNFPEIEDKLRNISNLDENYFLVGIIMVGHPKRDLNQSERNKKIKEVSKFI